MSKNKNETMLSSQNPSARILADHVDVVDLGKTALDVVGAITEQLQKKIDDRIVEEDLEIKIKP